MEQVEDGILGRQRWHGECRIWTTGDEAQSQLHITMIRTQCGMDNGTCRWGDMIQTKCGTDNKLSVGRTKTHLRWTCRWGDVIQAKCGTDNDTSKLIRTTKSLMIRSKCRTSHSWYNVSAGRNMSNLLTQSTMEVTRHIHKGHKSLMIQRKCGT